MCFLLCASCVHASMCICVRCAHVYVCACMCVCMFVNVCVCLNQDVCMCVLLLNGMFTCGYLSHFNYACLKKKKTHTSISELRCDTCFSDCSFSFVALDCSAILRFNVDISFSSSCNRFRRCSLTLP